MRGTVAVKKAAVDSAQADLQAARAQVRGIEAQAKSPISSAVRQGARWLEDADYQVEEAARST